MESLPMKEILHPNRMTLLVFMLVLVSHYYYYLKVAGTEIIQQELPNIIYFQLLCCLISFL